MLRIKEILKERNLTQRDLAERMSVSLSAVKQMVNADSMTTITLERIATAIGCEVWEFFTPSIPSVPTHTCPHCGKPISIEIK